MSVSIVIASGVSESQQSLSASLFLKGGEVGGHALLCFHVVLVTHSHQVLLITGLVRS